MRDQILDALSVLDVENDEHWTSEGLPRLDVVKDLLDGQSVTRAEITSAAKEFCRKSPVISSEVPSEEAERPEEAAGIQEGEGPEATTETLEEVTQRALDAARRDFNQAKINLDAAQHDMDKIIKEKELTEGRNQALDIKAFQESQAKARAARAGAMSALMQGVRHR